MSKLKVYIKPTAFRVLLLPDEIKKEKYSEGGIALIEESDDDHERRQATQQVGRVVAIGPTAFKAFDRNDPNWEPWCKIGDKVNFSKYGGTWVYDPITNRRFVIINDEDVKINILDEPYEIEIPEEGEEE